MPEDQTPSRVWLEISLHSLQSNFRAIQGAVAPCQVLVVLKADAYGLGVERIAQALYEAGARRFGVAELREAIALKSLGLSTQILGGIVEAEVATAVQHEIISPVTGMLTATWLAQEAQRQGKVHPVEVLVDTGMGRLGVPEEEALHVIREVAGIPALKLQGIYSHFPVANEDEAFSSDQCQRLNTIIQQAADEGIVPERLHIANSDGLNNIPAAFQAPYNQVRTGINLYGVYDGSGKKIVPIDPVLSLKTRIIQIKDMPAGASLGYGRNVILDKPTRVGTIAAGYADGLPMQISQGGMVDVLGVPCPVLGRISMDYTTIDLSPFADEGSVPSPGTEVTCLGGSMQVSDWARLKGTHEYDVICAFGKRVQSVYLS
ncbi:MAG: alanine racemase [Planctomycetota bacterium]|jgi:alanine racemase